MNKCTTQTAFLLMFMYFKAVYHYPKVTKLLKIVFKMVFTNCRNYEWYNCCTIAMVPGVVFESANLEWCCGVW